MNEHNDDFLFDEESEEVVRRYEQSMQSPDNGYFDVDELETIVDYYLNCGKPTESSKVIDMGLRLHPGNTTLQLKRAKVYLASGETRKALLLLDRINTSGNTEAQLLRGEIFLRMRRLNDADTIFQEMFKADQDDMNTLCLDIAHIYIANTNFQKALEYLEKGLAATPDDTDLMQEAAFCYEQTERADEAIAYYNRIIDKDPYSSETWFNLGLLYFNEADYNNALDAFDYVTVIDENDFGGWLQKGNTLFHLNRFAESLKCYRLCEGKVGYPDILHVFMGECYEKMEEYNNAKLCYQEALRLNDTNVDAWTGLGICDLELDAPSESIHYLQQAIAIDSMNSETWVYLAEAFVNTNQFDKAMEAYRKSLQLEHEQPDTWLALGNLYIDMGQYQTALDCYLLAYSQDQSLEDIRLFLAIARYKLGEPDKALELLQAAKETNPDAATVFLDVCPEAKSLLSGNN
jgi:tetratricopeptide (TPR) repeat protein